MLSPISPPSPLVYGLLFIIFLLAGIMLRHVIREPGLTTILTLLALAPVCLAQGWQLWLAHDFGRSMPPGITGEDLAIRYHASLNSSLAVSLLMAACLIIRAIVVSRRQK